MALGGLTIEYRAVDLRAGDTGNEYTVIDKRSVAQLEIVFRFTPDEGSNPSLSAIIFSRGQVIEETPQGPFCSQRCTPFDGQP